MIGLAYFVFIKINNGVFMNFNKKYLYDYLILFLVLILSIGLIIFQLSPAILLKADIKEPIKLNNSMCVCY